MTDGDALYIATDAPVDASTLLYLCEQMGREVVIVPLAEAERLGTDDVKDALISATLRRAVDERAARVAALKIDAEVQAAQLRYRRSLEGQVRRRDGLAAQARSSAGKPRKKRAKRKAQRKARRNNRS